MKPNANWMLYGWHGQQTEREGRAICYTKIRPLSVFSNSWPLQNRQEIPFSPPPPLNQRTSQRSTTFLFLCNTVKKKKTKEPQRRAIQQDTARLNGYLMWIKHYNTCWCSCPNQDSWCLTNANRGGTQVFCALRWEQLTTVRCNYLLKEGFFSFKEQTKTDLEFRGCSWVADLVGWQ